MLIVPAHGRLGNQLIQIMGAISFVRREDEKVLFWGFESACRDIILINQPCWFIYDSNIFFRLYNFLYYRHRAITLFMDGLAALLFETVTEEKTESSCGIRLILKRSCPIIFATPLNIIHFRNCYFQDSESIDIEKLSEKILLAPPLIERLKKLKSSHSIPSHFNTIHIRRSDFLSWPSAEVPAVLPLSFYLDTLEWMTSANHDSVTLVFSDDPEYATDFVYIYNKHTANPGILKLVRLSSLDTFILLIFSSSGVISSTFSLAAYLLAQCTLTARPGPFLAPKYWLGHRQSRWFPNHTNWPGITYHDTIDSI